MNIKHVLSCLAAALLLSACGNKGPLVMPQEPVPVEQPVPAVPVQPALPAPPAEPQPVPPAGSDDGADG